MMAAIKPPARPLARLSLAALRSDLRRAANPEKARILSGFFKTGPGQYGEGDVFLGLTVPQSRALAGKYIQLGLKGAEALLKSRIHEERLIALMLLVELYRTGNPTQRSAVYGFYMRNTARINNWDLVDLSSYKIVGPHLERRSRLPLYKLASSGNLWRRRIAAVACFHFIKKRDFKDFLALARRLLDDRHDLIHKAVGWMLREVGKRDASVLNSFLNQHAARMPRTMLRYAIEKLPPSQRAAILKSSSKMRG